MHLIEHAKKCRYSTGRFCMINVLKMDWYPQHLEIIQPSFRLYITLHAQKENLTALVRLYLYQGRKEKEYGYEFEKGGTIVDTDLWKKKLTWIAIS